MNGQHYVWYIERYRDGHRWACFLRPAAPHTYSGPREWLHNAEQMMRGDHSDCLWRKNDETARRLIWC